MRALITGVSGFVGEYLARYLCSKQVEVYGYDLQPSLVVDKTYIGHVADKALIKLALDEVAPDVIFHLAGVIKSNDPALLYNVNVLGTVSLLDTVIELDKSPVVVMASSSAVYGTSKGSKNLDEGSELHPLTHYALSKAAQEMVALRYFDSYQLPVKILRMFNLIGPGQPAMLACSAFARQIALGEIHGGNEVVAGNLNAQRDFVDVRDAAKAFGVIAEKGKAGQVYNVCSGNLVSMRRCLEIMLSMSPNHFDIKVDSEYFQQNDVLAQVGNLHKINKATGWRPTISIHQSLLDLLNDWRNRANLNLE